MKQTGKPWHRWLESLRRRVEGRGPAAPAGSGFRDSLLETIHSIEAAYQSEGREGCLHTGFSGLDRLAGGFRPGELMVIASAPGVGKTMLALNIASHVALDGARAVAIFSLEGGRQELVQRLLCSNSGVSLNRVRSGRLSPARDFPRLEQAAARLSSSAILMENPVEPRLGELRNRIRKLTETQSLQLVIIDSFHLLWRDGHEEEAAAVAREVKRWAREFGIVIVAVAQLDSPRPGTGSGRPALADLRSFRLVEHADLVALLWRQDFCDGRPEDYDPDFSHASLIVVKNRHGALGEVPILFLKEIPRFENRALEKAKS